MVCAYELRKAGLNAQLIEASGRCGGVIRSERRDGFLLELGPQSFSETAPLLGLCRELGIEGELVEAPARAPRYVLVKGALRRVPMSPQTLLTSSLVGAATKWSMVRDALGKSHPSEEDESVASFVRRKFSAELLDRLVGPFVSGVYAGDPERLSLRSAFPQLYEAEKSAGSVIRGMMRAARSKKEPRQRPTLFSFSNGNETLVRALTGKLGAAVRTGAEAIGITVTSDRSDKAFEITVREGASREIITSRHLILAAPTSVAGQLLKTVQPAVTSILGGVEYAPVALVSLGYRRPDVGHSLDGFGFLVPRSSGLRVLGTVWNSSLFPGRAPDDNVLLTSFVGGATDPEATTLSKEKLVALVHREITPLLTIAVTPDFSNVEIYPRALPQYNLGHAERLSAIEKLRREFPNLWLAGNYLSGPSIGSCIEQSLAVAKAAVTARRNAEPPK